MFKSRSECRDVLRICDEVPMPRAGVEVETSESVEVHGYYYTHEFYHCRLMASNFARVHFCSGLCRLAVFCIVGVFVWIHLVGNEAFFTELRFL